MISQFRQDAAHIYLFSHTHVTAHQSKAMGALDKPLVEELQKKVKRVSVLSGKVQNIPLRRHKLQHEPGKDVKTEAPACV